MHKSALNFYDSEQEEIKQHKKKKLKKQNKKKHRKHKKRNQRREKGQRSRQMSRESFRSQRQSSDECSSPFRSFNNNLESVKTEKKISIGFALQIEQQENLLIKLSTMSLQNSIQTSSNEQKYEQGQMNDQSEEKKLLQKCQKIMYRGDLVDRPITYYTKDKYYGLSRDGIRLGKGVYESRLKNIKIQGDWLHNKIAGKAYLTIIGHAKMEYNFVGFVLNNEFRGSLECNQYQEWQIIINLCYERNNIVIFNQKTMKIRSEDVLYEGGFNHIYYHGYGKLQTKKMKYEGEFKDNQFHGKGVKKIYNGFQYEGRYIYDKQQGQGRCFYPDKRGLKYGEGKYYYSCGSIYIGSWRNGQKHGNGKIQANNQSGIVFVMEACWKEGKIQKINNLLIQKPLINNLFTLLTIDKAEQILREFNALDLVFCSEFK